MRGKREGEIRTKEVRKKLKQLLLLQVCLQVKKKIYTYKKA